jgi:L-ascorbate metabolism protein UlaG (beta-lactamase superfamily)
MQVRYFGHSCFEVVTGGKTLLFDPFLTINPLARKIDLNTINPDYVLVTHAHYDHIFDAELFLKKNDAVLISNYEICTWMEKRGSYQVVKMNLGAKEDFDFGRVRMTAAYHSSTLPDGSAGGNPGGFLIESGDKRFYFAGDTGLGPYLEFIGRHWPPQVSFLPISGRVVMDAEDALIASGWLNSTVTIGMHYNAFPDLEINTETARSVFERANKTLTLLQPGQTITL